MLLGYHEDCSDAGAEQRMRFGLRWKHALGLGLEEGFDAGRLVPLQAQAVGSWLESLRSLVSAISWYGSKRPTSFWNYAVEHPDPARRLSDHNTSAFYDNFVSSRELL